LRRWQREALGENGKPPQFAECDAKLNCGVNLWMLPPFEHQVLKEDDRTITERNERGIVTRSLKDPDGMSMPEHLEYPVKTRQDWKRLKKRFEPAAAARFPADWAERCARWKEQSPVLLFQGPRSPSLFGFVRELMGPQRALCAFCDDPELVEDMMETSTELALGVLPRALAQAPVTTLYFWEDMCYKAGPLISPAMFRRFMTPRYKRITEFARGRGIDVIMVDSDGNVEQLIPLWLEAGVNGVYPMEVAAGMDARSLIRQYGRDLLMTGNIDKRALARDRKAIDKELKAKIPLAEKGGFIPHIDHAIPHDVPYANFAYYWERKKALLGLA
jgi:uroporphyrinogen decarboxylase